MKKKTWISSLLVLSCMLASCSSSKLDAPSCDAAANAPLVDLAELKNSYNGPHFQQCVHIRTTVYHPSESEGSGTKVYLGNDEIGGVSAHFNEPIHLRKGDSVEIVGFVDVSSIDPILGDEIFNCKAIGHD